MLIFKPSLSASFKFANSFPTYFLSVVCFFSLLLASTSITSGQKDELAKKPIQPPSQTKWKPLYQKVPGVTDFLILESGETIYLDRKKGAVKSDDKAVPFAKEYLGNKGKVFVRIYPDHADPDNWYLVAKSKAQGQTPLFIYKQNKKRILWATVVQQEHGNWQFHRSKRGDIFGYSRDGFCYRFRDGDVEQFQIPTPATYAGKANSFRPIEVTESANGIVCFYSVVNPEQNLKALNDLLVYDNGWKLVELDSRATGPAYFTDNQTLEIVSPDSIVQVDISESKITEQENTKLTCNESGEQLKPLKSFVDNEGATQIMWGHFFNSPRRYDVNRFKDGNFHKLAQRKSDNWKLESRGFDPELYADHHSFTDKNGNWWLLGCGGIYRKSKAGEWKGFDFRYGIDTGRIDRLKVGSDGQVWLFYDGYRDDTRILDLDELQNRAPVSNRWKRAYVKKYSLNKDLGPFKAIAPNGNVLVWDNERLNQIKAPPSDDFPGSYRILQDSMNTYWALSTSGKLDAYEKPVAWWQNEKDEWRIFKGAEDPNGGPELMPFQVALQARAESGVDEDYLLGRKGSPVAIFGPDKQVTFGGNYPNNRIYYFDGTRWHAPVGENEVHEMPNSYVKKPFFHDGKLTIRGRNPAWHLQIESDAWSEAAQWTVRPWKKVRLPVGRYPYFKYENWLAHDESTCPIPADERTNVTRTYYNQIKNVTSKTHRAAPHRNGVWFMIRTNDFENNQLLSTSSMVDPFGRWFVHKDIKWISKYYYYEPPAVEIKQNVGDLGTIDALDQIVKLKWEVESPNVKQNEYLRMRFRIDEVHWSPWQAAAQEISLPPVAKSGGHRLEVEIFDPGQMRSKLEALDYEFTVTYELEAIIAPLIEQLGDESFAARENATERLSAFGPAVLEFLDAATSTSDTETKVRAEVVATAIRKRWKLVD